MVDKVAIKESGIAHLELLLTSDVYVEQMALVTGVNEIFVRDEMRRNNYPQAMNHLRDTFVRYILKTDAGRITVPQNKVYEQIDLAHRQIDRMISRPRKLA
jgi:hypothetical protein